MKKIIALILVALMVSAMAFSAFAVTITIKRDGSFESGTGSGTGNKYYYYKIFTAVPKNASGTVTGPNANSGSYYYDSGTKSGITTDHEAVAYYASQHVYEQIMKDSGSNTWFKLTPLPGGVDPKKYTVEWIAGTPTDASRIQAAANWLISKGAYDAGPVEIPFDAATKSWKTGDVVPGYYVIKGAVGASLIAATTNIEIKEKNVYPSLDKTQADEDSGTQVDTPVSVAIGDSIDYEVKVTVPTTIKVGDVLKVWDSTSVGLDYNDDVKVWIGSTEVTADWETESLKPGEVWRLVLNIEEAADITKYAGKEVVFKYSMTINDSALVDTEKENTAGLQYGDKSGTYFDTVPDKVPYETYYAGIEKVDGNNTTIKLPGVKFTIKETFSGSTLEYPVKKSGSFYYPDTSGTDAVVETDASGTIIIRGLDKDKVYTLIEIETLDGYNLYSGTITLNPILDESGTDYYGNATEMQILNYAGTVLPSTGGIGTTIFYVVGGLLAVGAGVVLVTKKRMGKEEN